MTACIPRRGIDTARTLLFVPANRPERFPKALASGADAVVFDLEDSVPMADKQAARMVLERSWPTLTVGSVPLMIRINSPSTAAGQEDIAWLVRQPAPASVMVPKAESLEALATIHGQLGAIPLLPLIETAGGLAALPRLAGAPGIVRLAVGHIDFVSDLGLQCDADETQLAPLRFAVALATRLHGLAPAVDGVTTGLDDVQRLRRDTERALGYGFGAKLCIHPAQVPVIHDALKPAAAQVDWARRVVAADAEAAGIALQVDGAMVDLPVVLQARRILARAAEG